MAKRFFWFVFSSEKMNIIFSGPLVYLSTGIDHPFSYLLDALDDGAPVLGQFSKYYPLSIASLNLATVSTFPPKSMILPLYCPHIFWASTLVAGYQSMKINCIKLN
ncbi:hypothetical protein ACFL6E_04035 [Candidatus Neomarinimicrobiota bacterium]